jgi:hypothetical protein
MKKLKLKLDGVKEMLTKEQMKKISGGYDGDMGCCTCTLTYFLYGVPFSDDHYTLCYGDQSFNKCTSLCNDRFFCTSSSGC